MTVLVAPNQDNYCKLGEVIVRPSTPVWAGNIRGIPGSCVPNVWGTQLGLTLATDRWIAASILLCELPRLVIDVVFSGLGLYLVAVWYLSVGSSQHPALSLAGRADRKMTGLDHVTTVSRQLM